MIASGVVEGSGPAAATGVEVGQDKALEEAGGTAMSTTIEAGGDFVEQWIKARTAEAKLDEHILALVDKYRKGRLDEAGLLGALVALGEDKEGRNGSD